MIILKDNTGSDIHLELGHIAKFKPVVFAMAVHTTQGSTFNCSISLYEYKRMKHDMLYVALTRATNFDNVNFCDIEQYTPYTGCVYLYESGGLFYIGSALDLETRRQ